MNSRYPAYPNPTITEAVCDIHFRLPQEKVWRPSFPGELFKHLQNEYPDTHDKYISFYDPDGIAWELYSVSTRPNA